MIPPIKPSDKMRLKAFRVPMSYLQDCLLGYQGNANEFCIYRMRPDLLPEGFKIKFIAYEHPRNCFYFQVEHPSFPEVSSTEPLDAISLEIEEIKVRKLFDYGTMETMDISNNGSQPQRLASADGRTGLEGSNPSVPIVLDQIVEGIEKVMREGYNVSAPEGVCINKKAISQNEVSLAIQRNKNASLRLGAKMLLARSRHKGVNI